MCAYGLLVPTTTAFLFPYFGVGLRGASTRAGGKAANSDEGGLPWRSGVRPFNLFGTGRRRRLGFFAAFFVRSDDNSMRSTNGDPAESRRARASSVSGSRVGLAFFGFFGGIGIPA
jgi:hypothetical protein